MVSKFSEHLQKKHADKPEGIALNAITGSSVHKRLKKMEITDPLRKLWNSQYNKKQPSELAIPVKRPHGSKPVNSITCEHCSGYYRRDKLSVHLRHCAAYAKAKMDKTNSQKRTSQMATKEQSAKQPIAAIKQHSIPNLPEKSLLKVTPEFVQEVLKGMNIDDISREAVDDATLMKFGSDFHLSRRETASKSYIIRVIRDLAKIKILMKKRNKCIETFEDCFNPKHFDILIDAALEMAGYDRTTGLTKTPSVAYRLSPYLRESAEMIRTDRLSSYYRDGKTDRRGIEEIDDFIKSIDHEWKKKIGRISIKSQKISRVDREEKVALDEDIVKLAAFIESSERKTISKLRQSENKGPTYDLLMHMLVTHIMLLIRRRPVDFKNAKIRHFGNIDKHDELVGMASGKEMNDEDINICKNFHLFYVPGKNLNIVPMVLTPLMKEVMNALISERENVGINNDTLFVLSDGKPIKPDQSIKFMCNKVSLKKPTHLTGNGLRHQAATFSRLHSTHPQYQDYLASVLGHNLYTHRKHYELPLSITQKLMVCPILHNIMKGKEKKGQTVSTETQQLGDKVAENTSEEVQIPCFEDTDVEVKQSSLVNKKAQEENLDNMIIDPAFETPIKKEQIKSKWTQKEQNIVLGYFGQQILRKEKVRRGAIVDFMNKHGHLLNHRSVAQVYLFVLNHVGRKQHNVTPKVKRALKFRSN